MNIFSREKLAEQIVAKLQLKTNDLSKSFTKQNQIKSCVIDDLLEEEIAHKIYDVFPQEDKMIQRKSLREEKYVAAQMNLYHPLLEEIIYAFQEPEVVEIVSQITGIRQLIPDENLYAGGISLMGKGCFLNPHLDNSHDKNKKNYRVLNLLYYVTPDWKKEDGGNLELWDNGVTGASRTIVSQFNRLVIMLTNKRSYHSVSPVLSSGQRCCISNYYFSPYSVEAKDYFHVTSFRGRPEQKNRDLILQADNFVRSRIRQIFPKGIIKPWHVYKK